MRIQSKSKDYYDFVGQIHRDDDPRAVVWMRKFGEVDLEKHKVKNGKNLHIFNGGFGGFSSVALYIGDRAYQVAYYSKKYEPGCYVSNYEERLKNNVYSTQREFPTLESIKERITEEQARRKRWLNWSQFEFESEFIFKKKFHKTPDHLVEIQEFYKTPLLLSDESKLYINPRLETFGIQHWINPYDMHQILTSWFSDGRFNSNPPEIQNNKQKVLAHGFDLKTSFRHPIK